VNRTLILQAKTESEAGSPKPEPGVFPRSDLTEIIRILDATLLNFNAVASSNHPLVKLTRSRSPYWGLAMLGILKRHEFDNIYLTGEDLGIPFATLAHPMRCYGKATVLVHHGGTQKRRTALRLLGHEVWRNVLCVSARQREVLIEEAGLPGQKVHLFKTAIDTEFFRAHPNDPATGEYVFSCGRDSRDYPLLMEAAKGLPIPFRIVASGWAAHSDVRAAKTMGDEPNVVVERGLSFPALRDAYARARFAVFPLERVDYAAGVTAMIEAMAMGKAVIASASPGVAEYIRHGVSGLVVPVGDVRAMREAILRLWDDPALCERMGRHNRKWSEVEMGVTHWGRRVAALFGVDVLDDVDVAGMPEFAGSA
jgi:glycosyltransferase involved in cell wall biosynthesis